MKLFYLEAPGMYIGAHALIAAPDETAARFRFGSELVDSGVPLASCAPMSCEEVPDVSQFKSIDVIASTNGDY